MSYNPTTDFVALWRSTGGGYSKEGMPGADFVVAALGRAGLITVSVSATQPLANQNVTAWYQPAAPSYSGEGQMFLWDPPSSTYQPATMARLLAMLQASAGQNGVSWFTVTGGPPANTVGNNGDFSIRLDFPGGVYGPKAAGAWPNTPLPGTTYAINSQALDTAFGATPGNMLYRGGVQWQALAIGVANAIISTDGVSPLWSTLSALLDTVFSNARGSILYRGAAAWAALAPGTSGYRLTTGGPGVDPSWQTPGAEFPSGTVMLFRQTAAPPNWTKSTSVNDAGLRVTSGTIGSGGSVGFNTVFATTAVGNTTLTTAQIPPHTHDMNNANSFNSTSSTGGGAFATVGTAQAGPTGTGAPTLGGQAHTHSLNLQLSYVDVIIATKN